MKADEQVGVGPETREWEIGYGAYAEHVGPPAGTKAVRADYTEQVVAERDAWKKAAEFERDRALAEINVAEGLRENLETEVKARKSAEAELQRYREALVVALHRLDFTLQAEHATAADVERDLLVALNGIRAALSEGGGDR